MEHIVYRVMLCIGLAGLHSCNSKPVRLVSLDEPVVEDRTGHAPDLTFDRLFEDPPLDGVGIRSPSWTRDGSKVGFLRPSTENRDVLELWVWEAATGKSRLLVKAGDIVPAEAKLSDAQIQELERKRITQRGITSYIWAPDGKSILFPLGKDLVLYDLEKKKASVVDTGGQGVPLDPGFSPDGKKISFVRNGELCVVKVAGGPVRTLTKSANQTVRNGLAEFVAMEEMGRYRGYWWSPDGKRIAYAEVDESGVEVWRRASYRARESHMVEQRYPGAGRPNARVRVGILEFTTGRTRWVKLGQDVEYIARVDWGPKERILTLQVQPRNQKSLRLLRVDPATAEARLLLEETEKSFVNLHDDLYLFEDGRFLWSSERSGKRQLACYGKDGKLINQLTSQDLPVVALAGVDEKAGRVFYTAVTRDSLEKHLFAVSLEGGLAVQLTRKPGWHSVEVSEDGKYFVDIHSSLVSPPRATLLDAEGREMAVLEDNPTPELDSFLRAKTEFMTITAADGKTVLHAMMTRPPAFDDSKKHPVLVVGYGGPQAHLVANRWHRSIPWFQFLAQHGYIVFSVDPRGSALRGKAFEDEIHGRFGAVEVADHRAAVEHLATLPFVDPERIGIFGWSYGGTLVLMSLLQTHALYRCGIAVAPVTNWHWYDTHYTERYLGMPEKNPGIYRSASALDADVSGITESLLLIHGMADDNVFLRNSLALIERMQEAGVHFDLMLYPGKTHLIAGKQTRRHLYGLIFRYLEKHLKEF